MTGKRYLDRIYPYLINNCEDGYYLTDGNGFMLDSDELLDIGKNLIKFAKLHDNQDIERYNNKRRDEFYNEITSWTKTPKEKPKGYIYIMECGGKYKIGLSKDVERRKKELDNRPFAVNIVYKSPLIEDVYDKEKELHLIHRKQKVGGEWFELNQRDIEIIKDYLEGGL